VLEGVAPAGEFVPWARWAKALPFDYWRTVLLFRCDQWLEGSRDLGSAGEGLLAIRHWLADSKGPPPAGASLGFGGKAEQLWAWRLEGGESPALGRWLLVEEEPHGWDFHPGLLADRTVKDLLQQDLRAPAAASTEADYLRDRLTNRSLSSDQLRRAAEAGHEAACQVLSLRMLERDAWLKSLEDADRGSLSWACYRFLTAGAGALVDSAPSSFLEPAQRFFNRIARPGWIRGQPAARGQLQEARVRLMAAHEANEVDLSRELSPLLANLVAATRAIHNKDATNLVRHVVAVADSIDPEDAAAAERLARKAAIRARLCQGLD